VTIYKTVIFPTVLCDYSLILVLRKGHRGRLLGNRLLRRIFGPKENEMVGSWRKLRNDQLGGKVRRKETNMKI
jgi:hypothetical protein